MTKMAISSLPVPERSCRESLPSWMPGAACQALA